MSSVTFESAEPSARLGDRRRPGRGRQSPTGPAPRPLVVDTFLVLAALGFGATVATGITSETSATLRAPGGVPMLLGNLTGLAGTYLALVMVLLVSRIPAVERVLGQDGLLRWHRRLAPWPLSLISAHAVLLTYAYAVATKTGFLAEVGAFVNSYSGMAVAMAGFGVMVVIAVLSIYSIRRRLRRETWWAIHLGMYLAFALAFVHEIALGPSFVGHPITEVLWSAAWAATAGTVLSYRFGLPLLRSMRHRLRVAEVRPEADGVTSIILEGRHLERLAVSGGQFFEWRFLARGLWWQAHPYSLSARPRPPYLRLTVKAVGDHSSAVSKLPVGTRVAIEGPYGAFTAHAVTRTKVALIAGGVGVTAVRSLLEDLSKKAEPVVVLRASSETAAPLSREVREIVEELKGKIHVVVGSRRDASAARIVKLVPDLAHRDVFVSGPESFVTDTVKALAHRGVPASAIHYEVYAL